VAWPSPTKMNRTPRTGPINPRWFVAARGRVCVCEYMSEVHPTAHRVGVKTEFDRAGTKRLFARGAHSRSRSCMPTATRPCREISERCALAVSLHTFRTAHLRRRTRSLTDLTLSQNSCSSRCWLSSMKLRPRITICGGRSFTASGKTRGGGWAFCGQIYRETTTPEVATGDGMAIAYGGWISAIPTCSFPAIPSDCACGQSAPRFLLS